MPKPIVITEFGDTLVEYPGPLSADDTLPLRSPFRPIAEEVAGIHSGDGGWMLLNGTSSTHMALACHTCYLRVAIPNYVKTWGDLRAHFRKFNRSSTP